jgi:hypothetical protein
VGDGLDPLEHFDLDAELLPEFSPQAFRKRLVREAFAAGEFPQASQVISGPALGEEQAPFPEHETCRDFDLRQRG